MSPERAIEIERERDEHTNLPLNRAMTDGTVSSLLSWSITDWVGCNRDEILACGRRPSIAHDFL